MTCSNWQVHFVSWVSPDFTTAFSWLRVSFEDTEVLDKFSSASRWEESFSSLSASLLSCNFTLLTSLCSVSQSSACLLLFPPVGIEAPTDSEESLMTKTQLEERNGWVYGALLQGSTFVLYLLQIPGQVTLRLRYGWFRLFSNRVDRQTIRWNLWSIEQFGDSWSMEILAAKINICGKRVWKLQLKEWQSNWEGRALKSRVSTTTITHSRKEWSSVPLISM